jgi:CDGSH-type Zn-finger protein/uncharacterized Fe-S cluster protein YjdI
MSTTAKLHRYPGTAITVTYDPARCIHSAECTNGLPLVFDSAARPWVNADGADADAIAAQVRRCPSGALHVETPDGSAERPVAPNTATPTVDGPTPDGSAERPVAPNTATPTVDGPTYLRGELALMGADGNLALRDTRMALCRCGASQNKPFCDRSHRKVGFSDDALLRGADSPPAAGAGGLLTIRARANGPIMLTGPLTIVGANGRRAFAESTFLCRCGASGNKPYCDGTHKKIGFTA